jgi:cytochrome c oxidase cbb3-type subunit 1
MDRFVKNFIAASIIYLALASVFGVLMMADTSLLVPLKFPHSHLMLLGWVSMMIYGVGYHILPKFAGKFLKHPGMAEVQFWAANLGLVGMVVFYVLLQYNPGAYAYRALLVVSGVLETLSIFMFFYNMMVTVFAKEA